MTRVGDIVRRRDGRCFLVIRVWETTAIVAEMPHPELPPGRQTLGDPIDVAIERVESFEFVRNCFRSSIVHPGTSDAVPS